MRRPDLLIFVNGIPIAICEFKSVIREDATISDAWEQIFFRYSHDIPKLLRYSFLAVISDGIGSLFTMIKGAFVKERLLPIPHDFIFWEIWRTTKNLLSEIASLMRKKFSSIFLLPSVMTMLFPTSKKNVWH
ncbi:MAG: hypothetical protein II857_03870 [Selenomonadaceae bacterium]|nr:hypothetical protein [Selenomonadaceae bacterium]